MPPANTICVKCDGTEFDEDEKLGHTICISCGHVLECSLIDTGPTFGKGADGSAELMGTNVDNALADKGNYEIQRHLGFRNHRQVTERKCMREIERVCAQLKIGQHVVDQAHGFLQLALKNKLSRGRRMAYIIGACLYLTCRANNQPYMLIDIADALDIDVFHLGRAYQVVAETLKTPKTQIDPSIYISRFANTLDFGDSTHEVAEMATRLVKRMGRDWIDRGRRPTGLCGAALFIAARAKSFTIQFKDLERVAKIGHATIRKRLDEFECTDSATLSINAFNDKGESIQDWGGNADPPSYNKSRSQKIQKNVDDWVNSTVNVDKVNQFAQILDNSIEKDCQKRGRKKTTGNSKNSGKNTSGMNSGLNSGLNSGINSGRNSPGRSSGTSTPTHAPETRVISENEAIDAVLHDPTIDPSRIAESIVKGETSCSQIGEIAQDSNHIDVAKLDHIRPTLADYGAEMSTKDQFSVGDEDYVVETKPTRGKESRKRKNKNNNDENNTENKQHKPDNVENTVTNAGDNNSELFSDKHLVKNSENRVSENPGQSSNTDDKKETAPDISEKIDTFSDIDDDDINQYILPESDVIVKTAIWERENGQVYREKMEKERLRNEERLKKAKEDEELEAKGMKAKHKRKKQPKQNHRNTISAMAKVMNKSNKLSKKLNFDVLKTLGEITNVHSTSKIENKIEDIDSINTVYSVGSNLNSVKSEPKIEAKSKIETAPKTTKITEPTAPQSVIFPTTSENNPKSNQPWTPATPATAFRHDTAGYSSTDGDTDSETEDNGGLKALFNEDNESEEEDN